MANKKSLIPVPRRYYADDEPVSIRVASQRPDKKVGANEIKVGKDSGRVKAFVRFRPFSKEERSRRDGMPFEILIDKQAQLKILADGHAEKTYTFDHVFTPDETNDQVCKVLTQPLVKAAMNGFNGTLMAYGQTGTGKTYTLMSDTGITKSLIDVSFNQMQDDNKHNYKVTVSYLQIYQEKIFDLLGNTNTKSELMIRENPRTGVYVDNLSEFVVRTPTEVLQFLAVGKKRLVFAETKMNRTSSRSHAVLQMCIERTSKEEILDDSQGDDSLSSLNTSMDEDYSVDVNAFGKDVIIRGKIHICDLAGSERIKRTLAAGERLSEAQHINSSLLELGNVIQALADEKTTHVPFRNSVLTRLLQESLGGNCKTSLIICVSPSIRDIQETKCTLNFGSRAMKVTNTAYVNMEVDFKSLSDQLLKQLQAKEDEIHKIKISCKEEIQNECKQLTDKLEQTIKETLMAEELLKETHSDEIHSLQDQLYLLTNEVGIKNEEMKKMEDSLFIIDDEIKREKNITKLLLTTEQEFKNKTIGCSVDELMNMAGFIEELVEAMKSKKLTEQIILNSLNDIQNKLKEAWNEGTLIMSNQDNSLTSRLESIAIELNFSIKDLNVDNLSEDDLQTARYKGFLNNILNQLQVTDNTIKLQNAIEDVKKENRELLAQVQRNQHEIKEQEELISRNIDVIDCVIRKSDVGIQVDDHDANKQKGLRLVGTTVEDQEKVVTEIQTEKVVENQELKPARDIFSGFDHRLGRIEDMVAHERKTKHYDGIASRFGLTSYLNEERMPSRSSSVLDYRSDDIYKHTSSLTSSSYKPSYSTSMSDSYDSKYSSRKYDYPRTYGGLSDYSSSLKNASSIDSLNNDRTFASPGPMPDRPCMACGSKHSESSDEKLRNVEREKRKVDMKCSSFEKEIAKLQQENDDYSNLFEDISRVYPNDNKVYAIKTKMRSKQRKADSASQTDEVRKGRDQNSIKVAHIKPLFNRDVYSSSDSINATSNTINVTYDMNENDVVQNIASTQAPYSPQVNRSKTSSSSYPSYSISGYSQGSRSPTFRKNNDENKWMTSSSEYRMNTNSRSNLMEFSPENENHDENTSLRSFDSSAIFNSLRNKDKSLERPPSSSSSSSSDRRSGRNRPQTWYGNDNKEVSYVYQSHLDGQKHHSSSRDLNLNSDNNTGEVIFSSKRSSSSWALPDWMKTKKKEPSSSLREFIQ